MGKLTVILVGAPSYAHLQAQPDICAKWPAASGYYGRSTGLDSSWAMPKVQTSKAAAPTIHRAILQRQVRRLEKHWPKDQTQAEMLPQSVSAEVTE